MLCQVSEVAWLMVPALTKLTELGALSRMDKKLARKLARSVASSESSPMMRYPHISIAQSGADGADGAFTLCFRQAHGLLTHDEIMAIHEARFSRGLQPISIVME